MSDIKNYYLIDKSQNKCVNIICWDGVVFNPQTGKGWMPLENHDVCEEDGTLQIGDSVELINGSWQKINQ